MLKRGRITLWLGFILAISMIISACGGDNGTTGSATPTANSSSHPGQLTCVKGNLTADGSTALAPLAQAVAKDYQQKCAGSTIVVNLGGSKTGLSDVESGTVQIGNSDIFANTNQSDLVDHQVAVVVFTLILNSKVTGVTNLTTAQIKGIFSGQVTNWKQVGGPDLAVAIVNRPASSGTRATFQSYVLNGPITASVPASLTSDSTGTVVQDVTQTAGAIGYVSLGAAKSSGLTIPSIDGNAPTPDLVKSNTYKFWNIEHMYTKGQPGSLAQALIDYMSSASAKTIASGLSFISTTDMSSAALSAHQKH